jgi:predicted nucleic acid-binding protein
VIIVDASAVVATIFPEQNQHDECAHVLSEADRRILSPFVAAEIDYFVLQYGDVQTELRFLQELATGVYELARFSEEDIATAHTVIEQYRSLRIGLADASIVVLAERYARHPHTRRAPLPRAAATHRSKKFSPSAH